MATRIPADVTSAAEIDVTGLGTEPGGLGDVRAIARAIENARTHGAACDHGVRVAAIVGTEEAGALRYAAERAEIEGYDDRKRDRAGL